MPKKKEDSKKTLKKKSVKITDEGKKSPKKKKRKKKSRKKVKKYHKGVGRRKTAVARVRLFPKEKKEIVVNDNPYSEYFPTLELKEKVISPLKEVDLLDHFKITVIAKGGGKKAQAEATRHGIARALLEFNPELRQKLSRAGYLTRDPRMRERKKFGRRRARKKEQWRKR